METVPPTFKLIAGLNSTVCDGVMTVSYTHLSFAGHTKTRYETGMEERISGQWVMLTADARDGNILQTWVQIN